MEHRLDPWLALAVVAILGASLPTLHSVSRVVGTNLLLRQLAWGAAGLVILWLLSGTLVRWMHGAETVKHA